AKLVMALGRAAMRMGAWDEAARLLEEAATQATELGDAAYETLVAALLLLGPIWAHNGLQDRAETIFAQLVALCEAHDDRVHLGAAYMNRGFVWMARQQPQRALQDFERKRAISQEMGTAADMARDEQNFAEVHYQMGCYDAALRHANRAAELARRVWGDLA